MDTWEHRLIVEHACSTRFNTKFSVSVGSKKFTLGEISALAADYVATPGELIAKAKQAREFLNGHMAELKGKKSISETDSGVYTQGGYFDLAIHNYSHFRRGRTIVEGDDVAPANAYAMLRYYHYEARRIYKMGFAHLDSALLHEGFALHFLVDLFAAGHMRTPRAAFFRHFRENLRYDEENAHIAGAVLSLYQHDLDNNDGLECSWIPTGKLTSWGLSEDKKTRFHGDKSSGKNTDETDEQIYNAVMADIMHAFSSLSSFWLRDTYGDHCPWLNYKRDRLHAEFFVATMSDGSDDEKREKVERLAEKFDDLPSTNDEENYDDFLKACIPTVLSKNTPMRFGFENEDVAVDGEYAPWITSDLTTFRVYDDQMEIRLEKDESTIIGIYVTLMPDVKPTTVATYTNLGEAALLPVAMQFPVLGGLLLYAGERVKKVNTIRTELPGDSEDVPPVFRTIRWWYTWKVS